MFKLFRFVKKYLWLLLFSMLISLMGMGVSLYLPQLSGNLVNNMNDYISSGDVSAVWAAGKIMILLSVVSGVFSIASSFFMSRVSAGLGKELRKAMFYKVESLSQRDIDSIGVPSLITRTASDVSAIQSFILSTVSSVFTGPIMAAGGLILAISINPKMSFMVLGIVAGLLLLSIPLLFFVVLPLTKKSRKLTDKINKVMREKMTGVRVIRAFNKTEYENNKFTKTNFDLTAISLKLNRIMALLAPVLTVIVFGLVLLLAFIFIRDMNALDTTMSENIVRLESIKGDIMKFVTYIAMAIGGLGSIAMVFASIPTAMVSVRRVNELLDMNPSVKEIEGSISEFKEKGHVEFKDVSFVFENRESSDGKKKKRKKMFGPPAPAKEEKKNSIVIDHASFEVKRGETLGIIGGTGSGKSTVTNLIQRFYDVSDGEILINGENIKEISFDALRRVLGISTQEAFLFSGTIEENLRYGKENATEDDMWRALKIAQAEDFVRKLPDGLQSKVSQKGTNFSGGQRQRLAIARALIREAEIYIFDDSFSALDFKTDANLRAAIKESMNDVTMIIIAQRIGTIINSDRIVVLDEGKVVGVGMHNELLETCDEYKKIARSQLEKGEIA